MSKLLEHRCGFALGDTVTLSQHLVTFDWGTGVIIAIESDPLGQEENYFSVWALWSDGRVHAVSSKLLRKIQ